MDDLNLKVSYINNLKDTIKDFKEFIEEHDKNISKDERAVYLAIVEGIQIAIEIIKRGYDHRMVEFSIDYYRNKI